MCHHITIILAGTFDLEELNRIAEPFSIRLVPLENPSVESYLKTGERYFYTSRGGCACGTDLCYLDPDEDAIDFSQKEEARVRKAASRKKGWSKTKIERWIAEKLGTNKPERPSRPYGPDCKRWSEFFKKLFEQTGVVKTGLLLHYYDNTLSLEKIELKGRAVFSLSQLTPETMYQMKEDALNIFTNK